MTKRKTKRQHVYFQSKINREIVEQYELKESIINFSQGEFIESAKEQMSDLDINLEELSKASYISEGRLRSIFCGRTKITQEEVKIIKHKLHLT